MNNKDRYLLLAIATALGMGVSSCEFGRRDESSGANVESSVDSKVGQAMNDNGWMFWSENPPSEKDKREMEKSGYNGGFKKGPDGYYVRTRQYVECLQKTSFLQ